MKDDFDTDMRRALSQAEADSETELGFIRDQDPATPLGAWLTALSAPSIAAMRTFWWPNWRK